MTVQPDKETDDSSQPDAWLEKFTARLANCVEAHSLMGPMAWQYWQEEGLHHLIFFPRTIQLVGGEQDGLEVLPGFSLDVRAVMKLFQQVHSVYWTTQGMGGDDEGPRISVEGRYQGFDIWLRILAEPPADEAPGMQLPASEL